MPKINVTQKPANLNILDSRKWDEADLEGKITLAEKAYYDAYLNNNVNAYNQVINVRKELFSAYFAQEMTDAEYEAFQNRLSSDEKTQKLFDAIVHNVTKETLFRNEYRAELINGLLGKDREAAKNDNKFNYDRTYKIAVDRAQYNYSLEVPMPESFSGGEQIWNSVSLEMKITHTDRSLVNNAKLGGQDAYVQFMQAREKLFKIYLGKDLGDVKYDQAVKALDNDPQKKEQFMRVVQDFDVRDLKDNANYLKAAFFGDGYGYSKEEQNAAFEKIKAIKGTNKSLISGRMKDLVSHVELEQRNELNQGVNLLKDTAPNPAGNGIIAATSKVSSDKNKYYKAAALIVGSELYKIPDADELNYDMLKISNALIERKKNIDNLAEDIEFQGFVSEEIGRKNADRMTVENLRSNYSRYKQELDTVKSTYISELQDLRKEGNVPDNSSLAFFSVKTDEGKGLEPIDADEHKYATREEINVHCKNIIDASKGKNKNVVFGMKDFVNAADLVIAHSLMSKSGEMTFLSRKQFIEKDTGSYKIPEMNKSILELRDRLINDPSFKKVLAQGVKQSELLSKYKKELNLEVNARISKRSKEKAAYKDHFSKQNAHKHFQETHFIRLDEKEVELIKETYENLKIFNKGKDPSPLMQKLTDSLKDVVESIDKENYISIGKMENLDKANLNYYKDRQGKVFSPLTKKGQARLGAVEKLALATGNVMDRAAKAEKAPKQKVQAMGK